MIVKVNPVVPPSVQEKLVAWQRVFQDMNIDPSIDAFGGQVADEIGTFCSNTPAARIAYHSHMHMAKGVAICFKTADTS